MDIQSVIRARRLSISNKELIIATMENNLVKIEDLLNTGADVNFKDRDGNTALHWAVECGNVKAVELLLSMGAMLDEKNDKNETPLDISKNKNFQELTDILRALTVSTPLQNEIIPERQTDDSHAGAQTSNENMLERRKNAVHGNIYQLKLLMLFLYRGVSNKYSFRLGTEIQEAQKFDDLVFEYDVKGQRVYRFLQAKHRLDESKTINTANLLTENDGDYSLVKYFYSYLALKKDKLFSGGLVKDVTICTNINFDSNNLERNGIKIEKIENRDEILDLKSEKKDSARFKFIGDIITLLKPKLKSFSAPRFRKTDSYTDRDIKEFIERLVFAVNQPNEDELGNIVKNEISKEFDFITAENVYNKFFMSMLNWLQGKDKGIFLSHEDGKRFFVEFNKTIPLWFGIKTPVESFTGRTELLKNLHRLMHEKNSNESSQFVCVSGLAGIGKSELIKKYISVYSQEYNNKIVWINAASYETLADSFRRLACDQLKISTLNANNKEKKLNSTVEDVYAFFSDKKCLFIFDNAERYKSLHEFDNGLESFLPSLPQAQNQLHVLLTSRNQKWPKNVKVLQMDIFSENEAIEFVMKSLKLKDGEQLEEVKILVNELLYFPLVLQHAMAYISSQDDKMKNIGSEYKIINYLKKCRQKTEEYSKFSVDSDDYSKTTYSTWNIIFEAIRQKENGNEACEMLEIFSYFAPVDIPVKTIKTLIKDKTKMVSSIDLLKQYSIMNVENAKLSLHRLVLKVMQLHLQKQKREQEILQKALDLFGTDTLTSENIDHAISVWNHASKYCKLIDRFSSLSSIIIEFLLKNWRYEEAELFGVKASKQLDALASKNDATKLNLIATKINTAEALHRRGKYDLSIKYYEDIYNQQKRIYGSKSAEALNSKKGIAQSLMESCQYERALEICEDIINVESTTFGKNHPNTLYTLVEKAKILNYQGKYSQALAILKDVVKNQELILGQNHPHTLATKNNLASTLLNLSKFSEANQIKQEVTIRKALFGNEDRLNKFIQKANDGISLLQQKKYKEALPIIKTAYEGFKKLYGEDHPDSLSTYRNMGEALRSLGKVDESLKIFKYVYEKQKNILGLDHPDTIFTYKSIGNVLIDKKQFSQALKIFQESYEKCKTIFGEEHPSTLRNINSIGAILMKQEKYDEALKCSREILKIQEKNLGDDQFDTLSTKNNIATCLFRTNQLDEALKMYKDICSKEPNSVHPDSISTKERMVEILLIQNKFEEALKFRKELLCAREIAFGREDKDTYLTKLAIADLYHRVNKNFSALKILREIAETADDEILDYLDAKKFKKWYKDLEMETSVLFVVMEKNDAEFLQKLFDAGRDVNTADDEDATLLHYAVINQQTTIIKVLLKNGADVNLVSSDGNTALHEAAKNGSLNIIKLLLNYGSIYNTRNRNGATPLDLCRSNDTKRLLRLVDELFNDAKNMDKRIFEKLEKLPADELEAVQKTRNSQKMTFIQIIIKNRNKEFSDKVLEIIRAKKGA